MPRRERIEHGEKTIKMTIHFFTNSIPPRMGLKTAETKGVVHLNANGARGIKHDAVPFNDFKSEIFTKIQELLNKQQVKLLTIEKFKEEKLTE